MLQNEALSNAEISGKVLDLGGGEKSKYRSDLPSGIEYNSVNIDPNIEPTWLVKPGEALPVNDGEFDCCISLNTLEHVYDPQFLVAELFRAVKPGGKVFITVPWIFRIHGHPDDYARHTPSWWQATLEKVGFSEASVQPLVWGRKSTAAHIGGFGLIKPFSRHWVHLHDIIYSKVVYAGGSGTYSGKRGQRICGVAAGHFIEAVR